MTDFTFRVRQAIDEIRDLENKIKELKTQNVNVDEIAGRACRLRKTIEGMISNEKQV